MIRIFLTKILPIIIGLILIGFSVWLYFLANEDNSYILLFGLGTAILIPLGMSILNYVFNSPNRQVNEKLSELSKISDIQKLLEQAKTAEEKLEILKIEYESLEKNLKFNSEKISLELRRKDLIKKARQIINELDEIDLYLIEIDNNLKGFKIPEEIQLLRERVFTKQVAVIKVYNKTFVINKSSLVPFSPLFPFSDLMYDCLKVIEKNQIKNLKNKSEEANNKN